MEKSIRIVDVEREDGHGPRQTQPLLIPHCPSHSYSIEMRKDRYERDSAE